MCKNVPKVLYYMVFEVQEVTKFEEELFGNWVHKECRKAIYDFQISQELLLQTKIVKGQGKPSQEENSMLKETAHYA